jgi:hypothetical protein
MEREVRTLHVRHAGRRLGRQPLIPVAAVEHLLGPLPAVVEILDEGERQVADVGAEREDHGGPVGLVPHRPAARQHGRVRIPEAAHAAHDAEVVVERPVLLPGHKVLITAARCDTAATARRKEWSHGD